MSLHYLNSYSDFTIILESNDRASVLDKLKGMQRKIKMLPEYVRKKYMTMIITGLLSVMFISEAYDLVSKLNDSEFVSIFNEVTKKEKNKKQNNLFKPVTDLRLSQNGIEQIKNKESLRLSGYRLKDGKITIGWGHAEPVRASKYKEGQTITRKEADMLLKQDLKKFEKGVKNNLIGLNPNLKMTQDQYDVLVSLAYHKGVSGLFGEQYMQDIKNEKWIEAAKKIRLDYNPGIYQKGHANRRKKEANLFLSFLKHQNNRSNKSK
jgi:GH24 family phage-related lysozyme (muramidase)